MTLEHLLDGESVQVIRGGVAEEFVLEQCMPDLVYLLSQCQPIEVECVAGVPPLGCGAPLQRAPGPAPVQDRFLDAELFGELRRFDDADGVEPAAMFAVLPFELHGVEIQRGRDLIV